LQQEISFIREEHQKQKELEKKVLKKKIKDLEETLRKLESKTQSLQF
jgi:hypothetical protein